MLVEVSRQGTVVHCHEGSGEPAQLCVASHGGQILDQEKTKPVVEFA